MILAWMLACLGTYQVPSSDVGPYTIELPPGMEAVDLGSTKRASMFVARYRRPAPAPDQQVILSRPTRVSDAWSDGALPASATELRAMVMPLQYESATWLGGEASLGRMESPDGVQMFMWAAVRDGWLYELQCSVSADGDPSSCQKVADSMALRAPPTDAAAVPDTTKPESAGGFTIPVPDGWLRAPDDPAQPERLLLAAPPPPQNPLASRQMGHLAVEFFPDIRLLGTWVDALRESYAQGGMRLVNQEKFPGPHGEAFRSEYTDGLGTTFTFDSLTPQGMLHVECSENVARRADIGVLCSRIHSGIVLPKP